MGSSGMDRIRSRNAAWVRQDRQLQGAQRCVCCGSPLLKGYSHGNTENYKYYRIVERCAEVAGVAVESPIVCPLAEGPGYAPVPLWSPARVRSDYAP